MNVTIGLAFLAGLASFLSPCVFSLVPVYIGYLSGRSIASSRVGAGSEPAPTERWVSFSHGLAFVFGFSLVFITLGVTVSALGGLLYPIKFWIARIGGLIIVIFGLNMTGILRIPFLEYDLHPHTSGDGFGGGRFRTCPYLSSVLMGIFFSAGWSPCIGPVLGSILTLALNGGSVVNGVIQLSAYSVGMALPFLAAALGIGWVTAILRRFSKLSHTVEIAMGAVLIVVGILLTLGIFEQIASIGWSVNFGL